MNASRIAAVAVIFVLTTIAWAVLGGATAYRSDSTYARLVGDSSDSHSTRERSTVQELWGSAQTQCAPQVWTWHMEKQSQTNGKGKKVVVEVSKEDPVVLSKSRVDTRIDLDPRRKGLLWYSTYRVKFAGKYAFANEFSEKRRFKIKFRFPKGQAAFDNVLIHVNGTRVYPGGNLADGVIVPVELGPKQAATFGVTYGSQGLDSWSYSFGDSETAASVRDFDATVTTNCNDIDFPGNCLSPTYKQPSNKGWNLRWQYGDLISAKNVGVSMPQRLQPGPFASRLSAFAPVSLFFFFSVLLIIGAVRGIKLHPVHYLFLAATFFSFHLLFSYLVDHVTPFSAFLISSAVSLLLTVSYLRLVVSWKFAITQAGMWQFIFLVLFAYAFFFEGYTGLTITIGAVVTLAAMMQLTGRVNWDEALAKPAPKQ